MVDSPGGNEEFMLDVDDKLSKFHSRTRISREDVADLCVAALSLTRNCSFDCITVPVVNVNGDHVKTAGEALEEFMEQAKTANYAT